MKVLAAAVVLAAFAPIAIAGGKGHKIKESVSYATSWEAAVEEARLLNLPLVVHNHGFY